MATSDNTRELFRLHHHELSKYTYFLLTAAGAAIAFATTQTGTLGLSWHQVPLAISVGLWGASFYSGCKFLAYTRSIAYANYELLKVEEGSHPETGRNLDLMRAASAGIRSAMNENSEKADFWANWQFRCLGIGAVFYVAWHVWEMYVRT
jgi:hypothetical protein